MGIPTLIKTLTASGSASLEFVDGASSVVFDGTYDEYMFVYTDINPVTNGTNFGWQVNATDDAGGGYDTYIYHTQALGANETFEHTGKFVMEAADHLSIITASSSNIDVCVSYLLQVA